MSGVPVCYHYAESMVQNSPHLTNTHSYVSDHALKQDKVHPPGKFRKREERKRRCLASRHRFPSIGEISIENPVFQVRDLEKYKLYVKSHNWIYVY